MCYAGRKRPRQVIGSECPIALVAGFLGPSVHGNGSRYWGSALQHSTKSSPILVLHPSSVGSNWDRAIELFYELKGGRVDYGADHSKEFNHDRFGKTFVVGKYPEWSSDKPIHLVGHSFGGCTIRMLQHLLSLGNVFPGHETSSDWVLSITAISTPLNGSLATYSLGAQPTLPYKVRKLSPGYCVGVVVALVEYLDVWALKQIMDFGMSHWGLSWRKQGILGGFVSFMKNLCVGSVDIFELGDNAAHSMTIHEMSKWNSVIRTDTASFYLSVVATRKQLIHESSKQLETKVGIDEAAVDDDQVTFDHPTSPIRTILEFVVATMVTMGKSVFYLFLSMLQLLYPSHELKPTECFNLASWDMANGDGLLSTYTQSHPRLPQSHEAKHVQLETGMLTPPHNTVKPGIWYSSLVTADHAGIVPLPPSMVEQFKFFSNIFKYLRHLTRVQQHSGSSMPTF